MSEMVYVFAGFYGIASVLAECYKSLGGGSEQLQNGDTGALWTTVGKGSQCVSEPTATPLFNSQCVSRIATLLGQIPWLGIYLGYIPGVAGPLNMLLEYSQKETTRRLAEGSSNRDLFYYLVPSHMGFYRSVVQDQLMVISTTDERRSSWRGASPDSSSP